MSFDVLWERERQPADPRQRVPAKMALKLSGTSFNKPYPPPGGTADLPKPVAEAATLSTADAVAATAPDLAGAPSLGRPSLGRPSLCRPSLGEPGLSRLKLGTAVSETAASETSGGVSSPVHVHANTERGVTAPGPFAGQDLSAAATPAAATPAAATPAVVDDAFLRVFEESQRQTAEAHAQFQQTMAETHSAFLRSAEAALNGLSGLIAGKAVATPLRVETLTTLGADAFGGQALSPDLSTGASQQPTPSAVSLGHQATSRGVAVAPAAVVLTTVSSPKPSTHAET